jgi:hypothetical protein
MMGDDLPGWAARAVLCEELRGLGLPWVPEATRRRSDGWLTLADTHEAIAVSSALVAAIRRRGIPCGDELRDQAWRLTVAGLARLPRDRWPTRRPAYERDDQPAPRHEPEPVADDEPLVIRRRDGGRHAK